MKEGNKIISIDGITNYSLQIVEIVRMIDFHLSWYIYEIQFGLFFSSSLILLKVFLPQSNFFFWNTSFINMKIDSLILYQSHQFISRDINKQIVKTYSYCVNVMCFLFACVFCSLFFSLLVPICFIVPIRALSAYNRVYIW